MDGCRMNEKKMVEKKAAERLQRLLNANFDSEESVVMFSYEKSATKVTEEQLEQILKKLRESYLKREQKEGAIC